MTEEQKDIQEMADMGLIYFVYDAPDDADPTGYRLTDKGIALTSKEFPDLPLHESYYKWKFPK